MKNTLYLLKVAALAGLILILQSCERKRDSKGRLLVKYLTTSSGELHLSPMLRTDSASVEKFKPDTMLFDDKPYTGEVADYNAQDSLLLTGYIKNGLMDSTWKFYYASGGLRMEGKYKDGMDIGLWRSYYGYGKPKITKLYDDKGYLLMRIEYFDNGQVQYYQNVKSPMFGNKERNISMDRHGEVVKIYVEDSVLVLQKGQETEKIGENIFLEKHH